MTIPSHEQLTHFNKLSLRPLIELNGITTRMYGEITRENLNALNEIFQGNTQHAHDISHAKGLEEIISVNSKYASKMAPRMFEHAQHVLDTLLESANQYQSWFESYVKLYQHEGKAVVEKIQQATRSASAAHSDRH